MHYKTVANSNAYSDYNNEVQGRKLNETLLYSVEGPCFPQVLRRKKGKRPDGATVTHLVTRVLTPGLVRKFPDNTEIM